MGEKIIIIYILFKRIGIVFYKYNKNFRSNEFIEELNLKIYKIFQTTFMIIIILNLLLIPTTFQKLREKDSLEKVSVPVNMEDNVDYNSGKNKYGDKIAEVIKFLIENNISNYSISNTSIEITCEEAMLNNILKNIKTYKVNIVSFEKFGEEKWNIKLQTD